MRARTRAHVIGIGVEVRRPAAAHLWRAAGTRARREPVYVRYNTGRHISTNGREKLNDALQFRRDAIGDEQQPQTPAGEVARDGGPVPFEFHPAQTVDHVNGILASRGACLCEPRTQSIDWPVPHAVGGVVEHLSDDAPSNLGVSRSLDFDQRRYAVAVNEQVVKRVTARGRLPAHEVESASEDGRSLVASYSNRTSGSMRTRWAFTVTGDKISRFETGQA